MRISIVTSVKDDPRVGRALCSVVNQVHQHDLEIVVINAGSDKRTSDILDRYQSHITCRVNEPDNGIYDGMNKGISLCTGDVVGILNADDRYADAYVLQRVAKQFEDPDVGVCYGDVVIVDCRDRVVRYCKAGESSKGKWRTGWMPQHPGFFVRRSLYERWGDFDTGLKLSADYELMIRYIYVNETKTAHIEDVLVLMATRGASHKNLWAQMRSAQEMCVAWRRNKKCWWGPIATFLRCIRVGGQFLSNMFRGSGRHYEKNR